MSMLLLHVFLVYPLQRSQVDDRVILPLNKLVLMFQGPNKVIKKRYDKLLDYDSMAGKLKSLQEKGEIVKGVSSDIFCVIYYL